MDEIKKKRGRPARGIAQNTQCKFRTTDEQIRRLKVAVQLSGKSQADILREALDEKLNSIGVPAAIRLESDDGYMYEDYGYYDEYDGFDEELSI